MGKKPKKSPKKQIKKPEVPTHQEQSEESVGLPDVDLKKFLGCGS